MGSSQSIATSQTFFAISGIFQLSVYAIFLLTSAENVFKRLDIRSIALIIMLLTAAGFGLAGANIEPEECKEGTNCNFIYTQIIMNICVILTTLIIFILLYTEFLESSVIGKSVAILFLIFLVFMYSAYSFNFRGIICFCDTNTINASSCNTLQECSCIV